MRTSLPRSVLAVVLATAALGLAGCGAGRQAAGGPGGLPPQSSAPPAGNEQPTVAVSQNPPRSGERTAGAPGTPVQPTKTTASSSKPEPKPAAAAPGPAKAQAQAQAQAAAPVKSGVATLLKFAELYSGASIERGLQISEKAQALNGRRVRMTGYMAPPLKPSLDFFVLTKQPMSICPFCSSDADWPDDIILVLVGEQHEAVIATTPIQVTGVLEVGGKVDPQTGFYSVMRIYADSVKEVK